MKLSRPLRIIAAIAIVAVSFSVTLALLPQNVSPMVTLPKWVGGKEVVLVSTQDIKLTVPHSQRFLLNNFAPHRSDCGQDSDTTFAIEIRPKNGQVELRQEMIDLIGSSFPLCNGLKVRGYAIYYTAEPKFVGSDNLTIRQTQGPTAVDYHFVLTVR